MPTYEYECEKCGHRFELFQSMKEEPKKRCPQCKGKLRRLIGTGAGIVFKGSGFYSTDYRSDAYKSDKKKDSSDAAPAPSDASKKPEGTSGSSDAGGSKKKKKSPPKPPSV